VCPHWPYGLLDFEIKLYLSMFVKRGDRDIEINIIEANYESI